MSRIGNNPIKLPPKVEVALAAGKGGSREHHCSQSRCERNQTPCAQSIFRNTHDDVPL